MKTIISKMHKKQICNNLKASLRQLEKFEIRRLRVPLYQALKCELEENRFLKYQKLWISIIEQCPELKNNKSNLMQIFTSFCDANKFYSQNEINSEILEVATLVLKFERSANNVCEFLYAEIFSLLENCTIGKIIASINYLYGYFLFNYQFHYQLAKFFFQKCRSLSENQSWTLLEAFSLNKNSTEIKDLIACKCQLNLFKDTCFQLCQIDLKQKQFDTKLCDQIYENAILSENECLIGKVSKLIGVYLLEQKSNYSSAIYKFRKMLNIFKKLNMIESICEAHYLLFVTYVNLNDENNFQQHLNQLIQYFDENNEQTEYLAKAYMILAKYYSQIDNIENDTMVLQTVDKAIQLFRKKNLCENRTDLTECLHLLAMMKSKQSFEDYLKNIILNPQQFQNLLKIKNGELPLTNAKI